MKLDGKGGYTHLQIKDQVVISLLLDVVMQTDDVLVLELAADASLSLQLLEVSRRQLSRVDNFGRLKSLVACGEVCGC